MINELTQSENPVYMKLDNRLFARADSMTMDSKFNITLSFPNGTTKTLSPNKYAMEVVDKNEPRKIKIVTREADYYPDELIPPSD